jgi:hypothetical protein
VSTIDLDKPPPNHEYKVSVEREETKAERAVRLGKDVALFVAALALVAVVASICISALANGSADEKRWAQSILTALMGGLVGYLIRK